MNWIIFGAYINSLDSTIAIGTSLFSRVSGSPVIHDSDMSIVCHVDMTVSFGARSYDDSITQQ